MTNQKICRFAPSPTGFLHVGNIRAAIINFLYTQKVGGRFDLRLDDTDSARVKDEYRKMIFEDMAWLGLKYDDCTKQSDRLEVYEKAKNELIKKGRLYECYETPAELNMQRKAQVASGIRPIYDRSSLNFTESQKENYRNEGRKPYYRFLLEDKSVSWDDKIKGKITFDDRHFSDPVLVRDNNIPTYTFCCVVDDIEFNVTDIIRGEDHITNTAIQIQIFEALGGKMPDFSHLSLIKAVDNRKISKREGGFDVKSLRKDGFEPLAIMNLLSQIGTSKSLAIHENLNQIISDFDFSNFSKSSTNYDIIELEHINKKLLQILPFSDIKARLKEIGFEEDIQQDFWEKIRPNINYLYEVRGWWDICKKELRHKHQDKDKDFLSVIKSVLPSDTSKEDSWQVWLGEIKNNSDRKGKELFMPIRLALTGQEHGPELKNILPLIDRDEILARVSYTKSHL